MNLLCFLLFPFITEKNDSFLTQYTQSIMSHPSSLPRFPILHYAPDLLLPFPRQKKQSSKKGQQDRAIKDTIRQGKGPHTEAGQGNPIRYRMKRVSRED